MLPNLVLAASQSETRRQAVTAHTRDHVRCPACALARQTLTETTRLDPSVSFKVAAQDWLRSMTFTGNVRCGYVAPRTLADYGQYIDTLNGIFFSELPVNEIHVGHLRTYQELRSATAGPNKINQELGILVRIMKSAGVWSSELEQHYLPLLHEEADVPRALDPDQQATFLRRAEELRTLIFAYASLAFEILASSCEMRGLQIGDLKLKPRVTEIRRRHAKNRHRIRTVPIVTDRAMWAAEWLITRARSLGAKGDEHFLFPFCNYGGEYDPTRPMSDSGIKKPWDEVRVAAGLPWFRIHDVRHTGITRLAEAGTPVPVIMGMAGHISRRMWEHYTTISDQAKRMALQNALGAPIKARRRRALPAVGALPARALSGASTGLDEAQVIEIARIVMAMTRKDA